MPASLPATFAASLAHARDLTVGRQAPKPCREMPIVRTGHAQAQRRHTWNVLVLAIAETDNGPRIHICRHVFTLAI